MVKRLNFIDKILLLYKRLCNIKDIYLTKIGIGNRIESKVWVDLIEKRLDRYNKDYKDSHPIDRTDHITTEVPYISPIVKYSDKIYKYITGE